MQITHSIDEQNITIWCAYRYFKPT